MKIFRFLHKHFLCYTRNENISPRPPRQLENLKKKFSFDANISCVMQETKIFHRGPPPSPLVLLYCTLNIENQAAQIEGGRFMEEILF